MREVYGKVRVRVESIFLLYENVGRMYIRNFFKIRMFFWRTFRYFIFYLFCLYIDKYSRF